MARTKNKNTNKNNKETKVKSKKIIENNTKDDIAEAQLPVDWAKQCYDWLEKSRFTGPIEETSYNMARMYLQQALVNAKGHQTLQICIDQFFRILSFMFLSKEKYTWEKFKEIIYQRYEQGNLLDADNLMKLVEGLKKTQNPEKQVLLIEKISEEELIAGFAALGFKISMDVANDTVVEKDNEIYSLADYENGQGMTITINKPTDKTKMIIEKLLETINDNVFDKNHKIFKKDNKIKVLFKNTISVAGKMNLDYWFEAQGDFDKLLAKCKTAEEMFKKCLDYFKKYPQNEQKQEDQEYIDLEQLVNDGWKEIEYKKED